MLQRRFLAPIVLLLVLAIWGGPRLSSSWQLKNRQKQLLLAIAGNDAGTLNGLVSENYKDDWHFDKKAVLGAFSQFSVQFFTLEMTMPDAAWTDGGAGESSVAGKIVLVGRPSNPVGEMIKGRAQKLTEPTTFAWKKEGSMPWHWKLTKVTNQGVDATDLSGLP